ncbi:MAG: CPBP family intramembrane metalloprotease, partial [Ruminococcus sp.]|nr:CPBP family intramembrane metalloprotease [Ruminococcus sp.]
NNPMALIGAISMALVLCTISSLPNVYSSETKEIYEFFKNIETDISVWGQTEFLVYTIFDIIVMSVLSEMFFRGAMFAVLRQFGDPFAIIITSIIAGLLTQNFNTMLTVILISFVASYGMIASGSVFTSVCVVIIYKIYNLALTIIEVDPSEKMPFTRNIFMIFIFIIGGAGLIAYWIYTAKKKKWGIARYKSELHYSRRFIFSVKTFPFSAVTALCVVCALVKAVF